MRKYFKKSLIGAAVAMAFVSSSASATFYTDTASMLLTGPPPANNETSQDNVIQFSYLSGNGGETFTNNVTTNTPFLGGTVNVIGSNLLQVYNLNTNTNVAATYNGDAIVGVFALTGTTTAGTEPTFAATGGKLAYFTIPFTTSSNTAYNRYDPTTWGAVNVAQTLLNAPIAVFDLASPDAVLPGTGDGSFNLTSAEVNNSSVNTTTVTNTQGNFLFVPEDGGPLTNTDNTDLYPVPGLDWLTITDPTGDPNQQGLVNNISESITTRSSGATSFDNGISSLISGLTGLNTIGQVLGGFTFASSICQATSPGVPANLCSAAQLADATAFAVSTQVGSGIESADIMTNLGTFSDPGTSIPEPATLALLGIGLAGMGARFRKRA